MEYKLQTMKENIFCVIPTYNEEKNILSVIDAVKDKISRIVIVDDGSTDNTLKIVRKKNVTVISHLVNRGQGAALMQPCVSGMATAFQS